MDHAIILWVNKTKVKNTISVRFKNNKLTWVLGGTIASIILLILLKVWLSGDNEALVNIAEKMGIEDTSFLNSSSVVYEAPRKKLTLEEAKLKIKLSRRESRRMLSSYQSYRIEQERLLKAFQDTIHLKMNFPGHLHYTAVDLEDDVGAIMGTTTNLDQTFAVLATSRKVDVNQVIGYLKEETEVFPMLKGHEFRPEKAFKFNPPESTGLGALTVIPSSTHEGRDLYAVLGPRADGKGNYLFMMEAKKTYFEANEDGFEMLLDGMQTKP